MLVVHATQKLLKRLPHPVDDGGLTAMHPLCNWYATAWFWRPQLMLLLHESTAYPVVMPLAPADGVAKRLVDWIELTLRMGGHDADHVDRALAVLAGATVRFAKTSNRSVVSTMNQFSFQAEVARDYHGEIDPVRLARRLAETPTNMLRQQGYFPDKAMAALLASL